MDDLSNFLELRHLDLSNNELSSSDSLSGLKHLESLQQLNLSHNQLADLNFLSFTTVRILNIAHNQITSLQVLPTLKPKPSRLIALIANDNQITRLEDQLGAEFKLLETLSKCYL